MITTGATGQAWRASVTPWGGLQPWGATSGLNWFVAADDRWHIPAEEPTIRQIRIEGTPVTETRVRVPSGDVVQRIFSVADRGGLTIVEFENESTLPVAVAFDRRDVLTERPIVDMPIEGIPLPPGSFALPLGHRASMRVGVTHGVGQAGPLPGGLPTASQVVRGWLALTQRASRFVLPEADRWADLAERVTAERCELALGAITRSEDDPVRFAVAVGELVRMGEHPDPWIPELVAAVERIAPDLGWGQDMALAAAGRVLAAAGETRARRDLDRIVLKRIRSSQPKTAPEGVLLIAWLETMIANEQVLLPNGWPTAWLGQSVETFGVPTGDSSTVSFAIRWHADRPAVLWEQRDGLATLTSPCAPGWRSGDAIGETLWPAPVTAPSSVSTDNCSFS